MIVAYLRVSSTDQNLDRQRQAIKQYDVERIFEEKISGKNTDRPKFKELMNFVREGDTVVVADLTRLCRSTIDLFDTVAEFDKKGVKLISIKEGTIDTSTPTGKLIFGIFALIAEFERENTRERQAEGIAIAKAQGKYKGRQEKVLDNEDVVMKAWIDGKITATKAAELLGCTRGTIYNKKAKYVEVA